MAHLTDGSLAIAVALVVRARAAELTVRRHRAGRSARPGPGLLQRRPALAQLRTVCGGVLHPNTPRERQHEPARTALSLNFFPMFVPSLSWQNDRF
eukprot:COSAG06_NODE_3406_length_5389_cov_10.183309_3_plen_96_part_00